MPAYILVESDVAVGDGKPELSTRFAWRAERRARKLNEGRAMQSYRYEVTHSGGRWHVVAFQNYLRPSS